MTRASARLIWFWAVIAAGCGQGGGASSHRPYPQITTGGDPLLKPLRVVTIVAQDDPDADQLFAFGDALVGSAWFRTVGADYGLGAAGPSVHVTGGPLVPSGQGLSDGAIKTYIAGALGATSSSPMPDGRSVYVLYLPPNVAVAGNRKCNGGFGGFHEAYGTRGDNLAVVQRCPPLFEIELDQITMTASHEILESATDTGGNGWGLQPAGPPWRGSVWATGDTGAPEEVGDLCEGTRVREGGFYYQRIFSNTAASRGDDPCVPALSVPYYNVFAAQDWYSGAGGTTVGIPITAWATAPIAAWVVSAGIGGSSDASLNFTATVKRTTSTTINGMVFDTIAGGAAAVVQVQVPQDAVSGSWAQVALVSSRIDGTHPSPSADDDDLHLWLAGVYVP